MSDPYAETDEWLTPSLPARPATHSPEQPVSVTGDAEGAREARYAEAIGRHMEWLHGEAVPDDPALRRAVMAVADEEQAALRDDLNVTRGMLQASRRHVEAAEDQLRKVAELADEWERTVYKLAPGYPMTINEFCRYWFKAPLRAVLAAPPAAPEAAECGAEHPTNPSAVPCVRDLGHEGSHMSTTGCGGSVMHWPPAPVSSGEAGTGEAGQESARLVAMEQGASRRSQHPWMPPAPVVAASAEGGE